MRARAWGMVLMVAWMSVGCAATSEPQPQPQPQPHALGDGRELAALSWLSGSWSTDADDALSEEHWSLPRGATMMGMSRTVKAGETVDFEYMRIEERADGIVLVASPSNQATTEFRLTSKLDSGSQRVVFDNPRHDFPKRISYWRKGDMLHARVDAGTGGGAHALEWAFRRTLLEPAPSKAPLSDDATRSFIEADWFDSDIQFDAAWHKGDAKALGFDLGVLEGIVREGERTKSDALLVMKDGQLVVERYYGKPRGPIETMSATKSIVSIVIGMLIDQGKIANVDAPLSTWFPDWKQGLKSKVTLRHVLTHTSGLEHGRGAGMLNKQADRSAYVRKSRVVEEPGSQFSYSNEAVQLLAEVIARAAEMPLDRYATEHLFTPLQIHDVHWEKDKAGNVQTFYGLALTARDLARIGQLMLTGGRYNGRQLVSSAWVEASTREALPNTGHGLLWWMRYAAGHVEATPEGIEALARGGLTSAATLRPLLGRPLSSTAAFWMEAGALLQPEARNELGQLALDGARPFREVSGPWMGFAADGWLGQQLIVLPDRHLVAVRQLRAPADGSADDAYNRKYGFFDLVKRLDRALRP